MKAIGKAIQNPQKYLYKQFYSTSSDKKGAKMNLELYEIPTEEEIEFEVSKSMPKDAVSAKSKSDAIFSRSKKCEWDSLGITRPWLVNGGDQKRFDRLVFKWRVIEIYVIKYQ